jgi:proton-dependent oligopeptide transporter, POT family
MSSTYASTPAPHVLAEPLQGDRSFFGHPRGLLICSATEFWERFSYYGMRALLIFYLTQHFLFSDDQSFLIYGAYTATVYMTPILGGFIADRYLGAKRAVMVGAVMLVLGHFGMAIEGSAATQRVIAGQTIVTRDGTALQIFFLSLALIATGVGFLKSNATALVGSLYPANDPRRDPGFTLYYLIYNVGAFAAPLICGWIGATYGWASGFGLAGIGMLAGLVVFLRGQRYLPYGDAPALLGVRRRTLVYAGAIGIVVVVWLMLRDQHIVGPLLLIFGCGVGVLLLYYAFAHCTRVERDRLLVCAALIVTTIVFWALYEQQGSALNVFTDRMVDRRLFGYLVPSAMLQSLNPFFVLLGAPVASSVWLALGRRGRNPSAAVKFSLAIGQVALAFLLLSVGTVITPAGDGVPLGWLVIGILLITSGELCLAPVGMAMVSALAPRRILGVMVGAFFLAYSASSFLAGQLAQLTSAKTMSGIVIDRGVALHTYTSIFARLGFIGLAFAILLLMLSPLLTRRMHET